MPGSVVPLAMFFYLGKILDFGELTLVLTINCVFLLKKKRKLGKYDDFDRILWILAKMMEGTENVEFETKITESQ